MDKTRIRKQMLLKLKQQKKLDREKKSDIIKNKLFGSQDFKVARRVMFYVSLDYEVDTKKMIKEALEMGKVVVVPVTSKKDKTILPSKIVNFEEELAPANFGIWEPKPQYLRLINPKDLELVIVPGLAFDKQGRRIGHGGGYYDQFLKTISPHTTTIGLAFDFQILDFLPTTPHDIPVSGVLSA